MKKLSQKRQVLLGAVFGVFIVGGYLGLSFLPSETYSADSNQSATAEKVLLGGTGIAQNNMGEKNTEAPQKAIHLQTPKPMRAIYMTQCVAGTPSWRDRMAKMVDETELNSMVVDIKDYSGTIAFRSENPALKENDGKGCRASDMREFVSSLHEKNIYVIGRITVFQDPYYTKAHPELAVKRKSDGGVWHDRKGLAFIDVGARPFWDYIIELSKESYTLGFDELNFDYIRFPSDGDMKDIDFTHSRGKTKPEALREFFEYLNFALKSTGVVMSADLFGMTTTNTDDLNIGQVLENTLPYFDYIYPMVYPSHYPTGFNGWKDVNAHPYDIVKFSLDRAVVRTKATTTTIKLYGSEIVSMATGTKPTLYSKPAFSPDKIRPWLQDFDYPVTYTEAMVKAQIQATYDAGLDSWLMWDPGNKYTAGVYKAE